MLVSPRIDKVLVGLGLIRFARWLCVPMQKYKRGFASTMEGYGPQWVGGVQKRSNQVERYTVAHVFTTSKNKKTNEESDPLPKRLDKWTAIKNILPRSLNISYLTHKKVALR